ncbi:ThuA domain-containing protein [Paenibacillus sp. N4]|uniref:ThuA domain-containing protein n=1 Tax=Paenibacillus vietnamensis TaxID=2590547 RepID=UPI001CD09887|nr:ThuA domain-containing protein [Paenibacillus vietnamensis]MCA0758474.1 ThuA domain-containing protein [Paenibacillus vietnamensis]
MKIGVICHDYWHPGQTMTQGLEPLKAEGFRLDFIQDGEACTSSWLEDKAAVLIAKSNDAYTADSAPWLTEEKQTLLRSFVENGGGLLVLHSGTVGYRNETAYFELIGGVFVSHPKACEVTVAYAGEPVLPVKEPGSFTVHDEHYFVEVLDERIKVIMTSVSEHGTQPAGWVREQGKGRVCVLTPGHFLEALLHPGYQAAIAGGLRWCGGGSL